MTSLAFRGGGTFRPLLLGADGFPEPILYSHASRTLNMPKESETPEAEPLSEQEERLLSAYEKLPRGGLLRHEPLVILAFDHSIRATADVEKKRTYFDSGEFALFAANRVTDNGAMQTGTAHPVRQSISHPYAPVPGTSNVNKAANSETYEKRSPSPEMTSTSSAARETGLEHAARSDGKEQKDDW
ncbi:hypothetical protein BBP40_003505 [Aspergillus hancockii]|nr:hypothetical protein BBP40_003505 [Aspergillus hancockii]